MGSLFSSFFSFGRQRESTTSKRRRKPLHRLNLEALEDRLLLASPADLIPGQVYQDAAFYDFRGDTVNVKVLGPTTLTTGFTLSLAGGGINGADINNINLIGLNEQNSLVIQVTPNELTITSGGESAKMFSSGYVNVASITSVADPASPGASATTALGGIHLSAAAVNSISLANVDIGNITLDTGMVAYVDAVNGQNPSAVNVNVPVVVAGAGATLEEVVDESNNSSPTPSYNPCAGLIDLGDIRANSISSLVVNGVIGSDTGNPYAEPLPGGLGAGETGAPGERTNDLDGVISVSGTIGSIVAPQGALRGAVRAASIGSVEVGMISGDVTTTDSTQAFTIALPTIFAGIINSAGHLNLGFPNGDTEHGLTGEIRAGGGISGVDSNLTSDPIYVPGNFPGVVTNTSVSQGIADIVFEGAALSHWTSAAGIGKITANIFGAGFLVEAGANIGDITATQTTVVEQAQGDVPTRVAATLEGHFQAGGSIGNIKSAVQINAEVIAGLNIGSITANTGGINSRLILAGGNIGDIAVYQQVAPSELTHITATGNIGNIRIYSGDWSARTKADSIGNITLDSGSLTNAVFVAAGSIGDVTVTKQQGDAIVGGSIIAGLNIGNIAAYAFQGTAILGTLIQAGDVLGAKIASVSGRSYSVEQLPAITPETPRAALLPNSGIVNAQILAAAIGPILGQAYAGTGIYQVVIHSQLGRIDAITGIGNSFGIYKTTVVAEEGIGNILGQSTVQGDGISGGTFDANGWNNPDGGDIGQITGLGGPAGGHGIKGTRFQATDQIAGISGTANANGGNALDTISTYAADYGRIKALVLGGQLGNGIVGCTIKAFTDYSSNRPDVQIAGIEADVRSALGMGISNTTVNTKGDLVSLRSTAFNASAISGSTFSVSSGDFGSIYANSINSGTAIENSIFQADGSITTATDLASVETSGIIAIANSSSILANAISGSTFIADGNIGVINALTNGGTAILNSTFTADSDFGNANNGPNLDPGLNPNSAGDEDQGALFGIYAQTSGAHLLASAGIAGSTFEGELINTIWVKVTDREQGGPGITGSIFTARNAVYDDAGNFDNMGAIGRITVTNGSLNGNGIDTSTFTAGAGGSIGDITVNTLGGVGIYLSSFSATTFDFDQAEFDSRIGNIRVTTGRAAGGAALPPPPNNAWTALPAGISTSYFAANAGIGNIDVNSIGTGVFFSAFLADGIPGLILPALAPDVEGNIGDININSNGRFGAGSIFSLFTGANIGGINLQVASRDPNGAPISFPNLPGVVPNVINQAIQFFVGLANFVITSVGPAASAGSFFVARNGDIGSITVKNTGPGPDALLSVFAAVRPTAPFMGLLGAVDDYLSLLNPLKGNLLWGIPFGTTVPEAPTATSIVAPARSLYTEGTTLRFEVKFTGSVTVTGQPTLPVRVGAATKQALYLSGSGSSTLVFALTVTAGDNGQVSLPAGTTIQTDIDSRILVSANNTPVTGLAPATIGSTTGVIVDATPPIIVSVSTLATTGYKVGKLLTVGVVFDEAVRVTGQPGQLPYMLLSIGGLLRKLVYVGGSGTTTLTFKYTMTKADVATKQVATSDRKIRLPAKAKITDLAGNPAVLS